MKTELLYLSLLDSGVTQGEMSSLTLWGRVITTVDWYLDAILTIKVEVPHPNHQLVEPQSPVHNFTWVLSSYPFVRLEMLHHKCKMADRRGDSPSTTYITVKSFFLRNIFRLKVWETLLPTFFSFLFLSALVGIMCPRVYSAYSKSPPKHVLFKTRYNLHLNTLIKQQY